MFLNSKGSRAFEIELPASDVPTGFWGVVFIGAFNVSPRMKGDAAASYSSNAAQLENIISAGTIHSATSGNRENRVENCVVGF